MPQAVRVYVSRAFQVFVYVFMHSYSSIFFS